MAYIANTQYLRERVRAKIRSMRDKELTMCGDFNSLVQALVADTAFINAQVDKLWEPLADLRPRLRPYDNEAMINVMFSYEGKTNTWTSSPVKVPCFVERSNTNYSPRVDTPMLNTPDAHPLVKEIYGVLAAKKECLDRWLGIESKVLTFIQRCKSLNEAVKLWPDVRKFVPEDTLETLDSKPGARAEKAADNGPSATDVLKEIDLEVLNSSLVLARMGGAT
jgi:hypothetical protein